MYEARQGHSGGHHSDEGPYAGAGLVAVIAALLPAGVAYLLNLYHV